MSRPAADKSDRICAACGRSFAWRRKWARCWAQVRYCSDACRRRRVSKLDRELEAAILDRLAARKPGTSICPGEVARSLGSDASWKELLEPTRRAARRLVAAGRLEITQAGRVVDPSRARGPIRLRLPGK